MKQARMLVVALALTTVGLAQQPAPPSAAQPAAPAAKRQPKAKSQAELDAYKAAVASADPVALEKAADDFSAKFPDSELSPLLYRTVMRAYQAANNGDKLMEMGERLLKADPNDPESLVDVAQMILERTRDSDLDKDQRRAQAMTYAQHALETMDTDVPLGLTPEQETAFKGLMRSNAYSLIGTLQFDAEKYGDAADSYQKSIDAFPDQPDPVVVLRLAMAFDKQGKYPDALKVANRAVQLTQDGTPAGALARKEQDRLTKLTGGVAPRN